MGRVIIVDTNGPAAVTVESTDIAAAIGPWFPDAPADVLAAIQRLQQQVCTGQWWGDTAAYLGVRVEPDDDAVAVALGSCRERLIGARADAILAASASGRGAGYRDPTGERATGLWWLADGIETLLRDLDRVASRPSTDWDVDI